jgi:cytochrome P450
MIAGYRITKGTAVIAQLACINLDPSNYEEPLKFDPTRHLDKANHFVKDQKLNHFSYGRRACLGEGIAKMQLFLVLGTLFRHLTFLPIDRSTLPPIAAKLGLVRTPDRFKCYFRLRT